MSTVLVCLFPPCSLAITPNIQTTLHQKMRKYLFFGLCSVVTLKQETSYWCVICCLLFILSVCIRTGLFLCTFLLHTVLSFSCDFHPVTAWPLLVFHPILYQFPSVVFCGWCLCGHFCGQRRNGTCSLLNPREPIFLFQDIVI